MSGCSRLTKNDTSQGQLLPGRLASLDAYRGFVMFLMMAEVLQFERLAAAFPQNGFWHFLAYHQTHVEWIGCSLHDLIQPSFSFLVGVVMPFSLAGRMVKNQSSWRLAGHALGRSLVLIFLGIFLCSTDGCTQTNFTFEDTLTQIGLGYFWLFILARRPARDQWIALVVILTGYWAAFAFYPLPHANFDYSLAGVPNDWPHLMQGFAAHWNKNSNLAWSFDTWFLNLFPRENLFYYNGGGYATLSFIPTLATMILGLLAGGVLKSELSPWQKIRRLAISGAIALILGWGLGWLGVCPIVKRIWTPSWVLFSGGWCLLLLAAFYCIIDALQCRRWSFPLVVIGMNSIAAYCMSILFKNFIWLNLKTHLGQNTFLYFGKAYEPLLSGTAILLVLWMILFYMYRHRIFLKI
jgi:heparan-alpha-glucosaminide N-acetyltransferase